MAIDRRVMKTRTALYDALVDLIRERDYDQIRVDEILQRANVGRSTFYAHFRSKDELLERSLERLKAELLAAIEGVESPGIADISRTLFRHINGHRDIQSALAGRRASVIVQQAIASNFVEVLRTVMPASRRSHIPRELAIAQIGATFLCVMGWWLGRNPSVSWQEADALFLELASNGLAPEWPEVAAGRRS